MANERLILEQNLVAELEKKCHHGMIHYDDLMAVIANVPIVDAVMIPDKELLRAVNLLLKQYEHSRKSDYVHSPVAHALYHTWKQVDEGGVRG